jgi:hypothetical protein
MSPVSHVALRLLVVAEAEVKAELDVGRDNPADPDQSFEDAGLHFREPRGQIASEHPELDIRVPLQRELVVRDLVEDSLELVCHRRLVGVFHSSLIVRGDEGTDRGERRRQANLEVAAGRNDAVTLEQRERPVRGDRRVCVAERAEGEPGRLVG